MFGDGPAVDIEPVDSTGGFTFEVLVTPWVEDDCDDWQGLIALDAEGYVVWYYNVSLPGPVDQLSSGEVSDCRQAPRHRSF